MQVIIHCRKRITMSIAIGGGPFMQWANKANCGQIKVPQKDQLKCGLKTIIKSHVTSSPALRMKFPANSVPLLWRQEINIPRGTMNRKAIVTLANTSSVTNSLRNLTRLYEDYRGFEHEISYSIHLGMLTFEHWATKRLRYVFWIIEVQ
jgi:hypothetical protein